MRRILPFREDLTTYMLDSIKSFRCFGNSNVPRHKRRVYCWKWKDCSLQFQCFVSIYLPIECFPNFFLIVKKYCAFFFNYFISLKCEQPNLWIQIKARFRTLCPFNEMAFSLSSSHFRQQMAVARGEMAIHWSSLFPQNKARRLIGAHFWPDGQFVHHLIVPNSSWSS